MTKHSWLRSFSAAAVLPLLAACGSEPLDTAQGDATQKHQPSAAGQPTTPAAAAPKSFPRASFGQFSQSAQDVQQLPGQRAPRYLPGRVLVKLKSPLTSAGQRVGGSALLSAARGRLQQLARAGLQLESVGELGSISPARRPALSAASLARRTGRYVLTIKGDDAAVEETVRQLRADPDVEWAERDGIYDLFVTPNDPNFSAQTHLAAIGAPDAWATTTGSRVARVAVLDTGVDYTHPDLAANIWTNPGEIPGDGVDNDNNGFTDDVRGWDFVDVDPSQAPPGEDAFPPDNDPSDFVGHGTHCAGIVGATGNNGIGGSGVAWNVSIMPVRAGFSGGLAFSWIVSAIEYAVDNGADVISMSFGGEGSSAATLDAIRDAYDSGVLLVAAAGNDGSRIRQYPAAHPGVVAVAALASPTERAFFSSFGSWVDIAAPGVDVLSTLPGGGYGYASGTSMATPVVAGVAALLRSAHPQWSAGALTHQLLATANGVDASNPFHRGLLGAGRVNASTGVGNRVGSPSSRVASAVFQESSGNGDNELVAGETATLLASVRGFSDPAATTLSLSTTSPWLTITTGQASLGSIPFNRTVTGELAVRVNSGVPANTLANLTLTVQSGSFQQQMPLTLTLAPSLRRPEKLVRYFTSNALALPSGRMALINDDVRLQRWSVYASVRAANGQFSPITTLSNLATDAGAPIARLDSSNDVHVVFRQYDATHANPQLYYAKFTNGTSTWSAVERITDDAAAVFWFFPTALEGIGVDGAGRPHVAWLDYRTGNPQIRSRVKNAGVWQERVVAELQPGHFYAWVDFVPLPSGRLGLYYTSNTSGNRDLPTRVIEWDGSNWINDRAIAKVATGDRQLAPFRFGSDVYQFYATGNTSGHPVHLGKQVGDAWSFQREILPFPGVGLESDSAYRMTGSNQFQVLRGGMTNPLTFGSNRNLLRIDGTTQTSTDLPGSPYTAALSPVIGLDTAGKSHLLTSEYTVQTRSFGFLLINSEATYYTDAPAPSRVLPTLPVVTDDGASTTTASSIHASWTSTHSSGIRHYDVAVGTTPWGDDVVPWTNQSGTQATISLADSPLEPGQSYYVSVQSSSNAIYTSLLGRSDGIVLSGLPRCTAPVWKSVVAYDPGVEVSYQGNKYRSLYFNSSALPTNQNGPWQLMGACSGQPEPRRCSAVAWNSGQTYPAGAVVKHNGGEFVAQWYVPQNSAPTGGTGNPWKWVNNCTP